MNGRKGTDTTAGKAHTLLQGMQGRLRHYIRKGKEAKSKPLEQESMGRLGHYRSKGRELPETTTEKAGRAKPLQQKGAVRVQPLKQDRQRREINYTRKGKKATHYRRKGRRG